MTDSYYVRVNNKSRVFKRTESGFYDITDWVPDRDGALLHNARRVSDVEVAELVAQEEDRRARLERAEASLREWIEFRRAWQRKPSKRGKLRLQKMKKEAA